MCSLGGFYNNDDELSSLKGVDDTDGLSYAPCMDFKALLKASQNESHGTRCSIVLRLIDPDLKVGGV